MKLPYFLDCRIAVIGMGYVGLPLAVEFSRKSKCIISGSIASRKVIGFDINNDRIEQLKNGNDFTKEVSKEELKSSFVLFTTDLKFLSEVDVFIVTVPTPIDENNQPNFNPLKKASESIGKAIKNSKNDFNPIIIYESTVYPGATEEICVPILKNFSGFKYNDLKSKKSFFCGYSPERINPGDKNHKLINLKKITSGSNPQVTDWVNQLYSSIILAGTHKVSSIKVAEAAKVIENTQRDLNIALINELSIIFRLLEIDTKEVIDAAGTKWNFMKFMPGLVGGHCIGVDPYYLTFKANQIGYNPEIILSGRRINNSMGKVYAEEIIKIICKRNLFNQCTKILLLGFTFKQNCPDIRNTRVIDLFSNLKEYNLKIDVLDNLADKNEVKEIYGIDIKNKITKDAKYKVIILVVPHKFFLEKDQFNYFDYLEESGVIIDLKSILPEMPNVYRI